MARFNEILVGRYNRFFQKLFSMKGGPPAPQLASEVQPSFNIEDVTAELRFLQGVYIYGMSSSIPPLAANFGTFRLRNPTVSGVLAIIEGIQAHNVTTSDSFTIQLGTPGANDLTSILVTRSRDGRNKSASALIGSIQAVAVTQIGGTISQIAVPNGNLSGNWPTLREQTIILSPGDELQVQSTTANSTIFFSVQWRERIIEDSEKIG